MAALVEEQQLLRLVTKAVEAGKAAALVEDAPSNRGAATAVQDAVALLRLLSRQRVTARMLKDTDAGRKVNRLSKHGNAAIAREAAAVVTAWKDTIRSSSNSGASTTTITGSGAAKPSPSPASLAGQNGQVLAVIGNPGADLESPVVSPTTATSTITTVTASAGRISDSRAAMSTTATTSVAVTAKRLGLSLPSPTVVQQQKQRCQQPLASPSGSSLEVQRSISGSLSSQVSLPVSGELRGSGGSQDVAAYSQEVQLARAPNKVGNPVRDKVRLVLAQALALATLSGSGSDHDPSGVAEAVESAMFTEHGGVTPGYKAKFRTLSFNLKDPNNPDLRARVLEGVISPASLVRMSTQELASDTRKEENGRIRESMTAEAVRSNNSMASTDQFQCSKCKQRRTTYFQMQTRSADEPMTTFVTCINCGKRWKF